MDKPIRLLALIDFSDYSIPLIHLANEFTQKWNCKVLFIHQVPGLVPVLADNESKKEIINIEKEKATIDLKMLVRRTCPMLDGDFLITENDLLDTIHEQDHKNFHHWVMTGLKGTGLLKKIFVGSTTTKLVDETDLPLVTVPLDEHIGLPKNIICSISYRYPVNEVLLNYMLQTLTDPYVKLDLVTVVTDKDNEEEAMDYLQKMANLLSEYKPKKDLLKGTNALNELKQLAVNSPGAYLMLQQGSRSLTDMIFRTFMINELVYHGKIPLIIIPK
jgi:hypothetical protein